MIGFCPLASGSKGNCLYLGTAHTKILIDAGLSGKATRQRLSEIGVSLEEIDAILITHEHTDHIRGLDVLGCSLNIPVFCNSETAKALYENLNILPSFKIFSTGEPFTFGDIHILPFSIQHDAADPVAFAIEAAGNKIGCCTDLGFVTPLVVQHLELCDYLFIEANHEPDMVHACPRPSYYKQRVLGRQGHLSNAQCCELLSRICHPQLKHIYLAHLSSECNSPKLALEKIDSLLKSHGLTISSSIAYQERISHCIPFTTITRCSL